MSRIFRWILIVAGTITILFAIGFFFQLTWATQIWPLPSGRLSNIFISSILAAIGFPILWIGVAGESRAMTGGALNLLVTNAGFAISSFIFYYRTPQANFLIFAIISVVMVVLCTGLFIYSQRQPFRDSNRIPGLLRGSFVAFAVALLATSISLILQRPNTFPWALSKENSVMYGWIFLGAMYYFLDAIIFPVWSNARGQLIGFLAYDLVLIFPFIAHFKDVKPEMLPSLMIYVTVLTYSGLLAIYYLFINRSSRFKVLYHKGLNPAMQDQL